MATPVAPPPPAPVAQPSQPPAVEPAAPPPAAKLAVRPPIPAQNVERPPAANPAELAAAVKARRDAEATVARLQTELSAALQAKSEAEQARVQAETAVRQARSEADVARKEYELARNDANAANDEIDRMMAGGMPASFIKGAIFIGISAAAVLFFIILAIAKIVVWMSAKAEPEIDQDELVDELAKSLGVEEPPQALLPAIPAEAHLDSPVSSEIDGQDKTEVMTNGHAGSIPSMEPAEGSVLAPAAETETEGEVAKSIVPGIPNGGEAEPAKSAQTEHTDLAPQPANANPS
jgi:hypothetical protein